MNAEAVPAIPIAATGATELMANAVIDAQDASRAIVSIKKKKFPASLSRPVHHNTYSYKYKCNFVDCIYFCSCHGAYIILFYPLCVCVCVFMCAPVQKNSFAECCELKLLIESNQ